jgi:hypothetical protein
LFIAGTGRNGSTLLADALGEIEGVFNVGELTHIWDRGLLQNQLCGCGSPFHDCDLWQAVFLEAFGGMRPTDAERIARLRDECFSMRNLPYFLFPNIRPHSFERKCAEYLAAVDLLLQAVSKITQCDILIDTSKYPSEAHFFQEYSPFPTTVLHLLRDSRGVVFSWQKRKKRPEIHWKLEYMPRYSWLKTSLAWNFFTYAINRLESAGPFQMIRYEDFISKPSETLTQVLGPYGRHREYYDFLNERWITFGPRHAVSGNPSRFQSRSVPLKADQAWRAKMPMWKIIAVSSLTWPYLKKYGYVK